MECEQFAECLNGLLESLHEKNDLRVWSVVITIFGDSVFPRGGTVSATTLSAITERLHISPGTLRVSLSRLAKEDWISRHKQGRNSFYQLTKQGSAAFGPAARHIYAAQLPEDDGSYELVLLPQGTAAKRNKLERLALDAGLMELVPGILLSAQKLPDKLKVKMQDCLVMNGTIANKPTWLHDAILADSLAEEFVELTSQLDTLANAVSRTGSITGLEAIAARTLAIHLWRRLILRQVHIPKGLLPENWPSETCRQALTRLYRKLEAPSEAWLAEAFGGQVSNENVRFI